MSSKLPKSAYQNRMDAAGLPICWDSQALQSETGTSLRTVERALSDESILPEFVKLDEVVDDIGEGLNHLIRDDLDAQAKQKRLPSLIVQQHQSDHGHLLMANDGRGGRKWLWFEDSPDEQALRVFLDALHRLYQKRLLVWPHGAITSAAKSMVAITKQHDIELTSGGKARMGLTAYHTQPVHLEPVVVKREVENKMDMTHLDRLEAESLHIIREVIAESENPVMLYSIGKDSS
ncbi:MAG: hypothetical protein HOE54_00370, partial [Gammaproteobacteria bacterium]|nr:hypothetical protein [Gammaproteobacteria bacterium]